MIELTPGWVSAGVSVVAAVGGGVAAWLRSIDVAQEARITEVKGTQRVLFDKYDTATRNLQDYKLHVAESYVNREVLREQLAPINKALEKIDNDLLEMRRN